MCRASLLPAAAPTTRRRQPSAILISRNAVCARRLPLCHSTVLSCSLVPANPMGTCRSPTPPHRSPTRITLSSTTTRLSPSSRPASATSSRRQASRCARVPPAIAVPPPQISSKPFPFLLLQGCFGVQSHLRHPLFAPRAAPPGHRAILRRHQQRRAGHLRELHGDPRLNDPHVQPQQGARARFIAATDGGRGHFANTAVAACCQEEPIRRCSCSVPEARPALSEAALPAPLPPLCH